LTREQIVRAAIDLLDADGIEGLSMRQLGSRLGSAATAVYWHVKNKDDLVVLAGDAVWGEIGLPNLDTVDWRTAATTMAKDMYAMIIRHPWLVPAMSTHLMHGPGKARHDDHLLAVYEAAGFTGQHADQAATVVFTFVLGTALGAAAEVAWTTRLRRAGDSEEQIRDLLAQATEIAMQFPRLRARSNAWADGDATATPGQDLEFGLQTILDGLQARLAVGP
jgi:AcrR family transcriptional regulator